VKKKDPASILERVRKRLRHEPRSWQPKRWLDLGEALNPVLGDPQRGIPYGRIIEVSGESSHGKSAFALDLLAAAQNDGAFCVWVDFENSWDPEWASRRGVRTEEVVVVQPIVGVFPGEKEPRLSTAEEVLAEAEAVLAEHYKSASGQPQFLVLDSVASMLVEGEAEAGVVGQNMRTRLNLPMFLSGLLRRWIGLFQTFETTAILINQLRANPMAWGDPYYTPGGKSLPFYAHSRVRMKRGAKGGRILRAGKIVGIHGILRNDKNKIGGVEGAVCKFRIYFDGESEFTHADEKEETD
jgi:recombination protein RecA